MHRNPLPFNKQIVKVGFSSPKDLCLNLPFTVKVKTHQKLMVQQETKVNWRVVPDCGLEHMVTYSTKKMKPLGILV